MDMDKNENIVIRKNILEMTLFGSIILPPFLLYNELILENKFPP